MNRRGIITSSQLADKIINKNKNLKLLDASWYMPTMNRNAVEEFNNERIVNSSFFDLDATSLSPEESNLPHMLPKPDIELIKKMNKLGIKKDDYIVAYDRLHMFSSPRCLYMFHWLGIDNVAVLDGGYNKFKELYPDLIDTNDFTPPEETLIEEGIDCNNINEELVENLDFIIKNINDKEKILIDARSEGRFNGTEPEPRKEIESGHIPYSKNICFDKFIKEDGTFVSNDVIYDLFLDIDVDLNQYTQNIDNNVENKNIVLSCGSGVTSWI
eukprot:TRINITY_DN183_c1_g1_i2.p1 TRINITY_DN183_c1_g1~~TRINITY_DN183_c1_g1_i2.p1  ORF type:complete len:271 (-),score=76.80 TRINITY_DN183_c1_g1_i2:18-830(-)